MIDKLKGIFGIIIALIILWVIKAIADWDGIVRNFDDDD